MLMVISQELRLTAIPLTLINELVAHYESLRVLLVKSCIEKSHSYAVGSKLHEDKANEF